MEVSKVIGWTLLLHGGFQSHRITPWLKEPPISSPRWRISAPADRGAEHRKTLLQPFEAILPVLPRKGWSTRWADMAGAADGWAPEKTYRRSLHGGSQVCWLVVFRHPSEKWWSSSVGMMNFPIWWESHNPVMFQTTNQYELVYNLH